MTKKKVHVHYHDAGEFKEGDHPRATNGQFGAGGGKGKPSKGSKAAKPDLPEPRQGVYSGPKPETAREARLVMAMASALLGSLKRSEPHMDRSNPWEMAEYERRIAQAKARYAEAEQVEKDMKEPRK